MILAVMNKYGHVLASGNVYARVSKHGTTVSGDIPCAKYGHATQFVLFGKNGSVILEGDAGMCSFYGRKPTLVLDNANIGPENILGVNIRLAYEV